MSAEEKLLGNFNYNIKYIILLLDSHLGILRVNNHIMQYYRTTVLCTNVISTCAVPFGSKAEEQLQSNFWSLQRFSILVKETLVGQMVANFGFQQQLKDE